MTDRCGGTVSWLCTTGSSLNPRNLPVHLFKLLLQTMLLQNTCCVTPRITGGGMNTRLYRGNYYYDLSLRPRKTQRVNSTTPRSRRYLKSFPIFSNRRHVFRRLCPIRGPFIALRQCRRRVNSTTPRSRFLSASTQFATVPALE